MQRFLYFRRAARHGRHAFAPTATRGVAWNCCRASTSLQAWRYLHQSKPHNRSPGFFSKSIARQRPVYAYTFTENYSTLLLRPKPIMASDRDTLPKSVKPSHYDLSLYDIQSTGQWKYSGIVKITVDISEPVKEIVINANEITITEASVSAGSQEFKAGEVSYKPDSHRAFLPFDKTIPATRQAVLSIKFGGYVNNAMAGFYRSKYKPDAPPHASVPHDDEHHYMLSTQFESCDARKAFPCFDEPNLKASFDFEIEIPEGLVALSNMPEKSTRPGSKAGLKIVSFERTPTMSTYLLAWAVGDFEYAEAFTKRQYNGKNLPVRVYTTKGLKDQAQLALQTAHQVLDLFSEWFQIEYPLPKSDLLAVHEFTHGAMENWGLVTYRKVAVLFDDQKSDQSYKVRVAYVVAHELAHQWFGNLVTMDWWNELWLNEGFATYIGWAAIDHIYPEWDVWSQYVTESYQQALELDALRTSHPIEVPVRDALEVDQIFDAISYRKGSSVIRMLSAHLGQDVFLRGVAAYLKANAYGNATTDDLWSALSLVSGKDVKSFMHDWIGVIGFPVLTVAEEPGQITVQQKRYLVSEDLKPEEDKTIWWIPLGLKTGTNANSHQGLALTRKQDTIRNIDESFYKLNSDHTGFYRTNYPPPRLAKLGEAKDKLSIQDRCGVIGDAAALAMSGEGTTPALLSLLEGFQSETNYLVWTQIVSSLGNVRSVFSENTKVASGLRAFTLKLVTPLTERLGWEYKANEDFLTGQLRALLIGNAGLAGHQGIISESKRQFELYMNGGDKNAINPNLRSAVWRIAQTNGSKPEYEALKRQVFDSSSVDGKDIALRAMGRVKTSELAQELCEFVFSGRVAVQDMHIPASALAANARTRHIQWEYIKSNWATVHNLLAENIIILDRYLRLCLTKFSDRQTAEDIAKFFSDKDNRGYDRTLGIVQDTISARASYKERDEALILEWLSAHGYA